MVADSKKLSKKYPAEGPRRILSTDYLPLDGPDQFEQVTLLFANNRFVPAPKQVSLPPVLQIVVQEDNESADSGSRTQETTMETE
jgi:hypothetical protein